MELYDILPRLENLETIKIVFIGSSKPTKEQLSKYFLINKQKVILALNWLKQNNEIYKNIIIDETKISSIDNNTVPNIIYDNIQLVEENDNDEEKDKDINDLDNEIFFDTSGFINNNFDLIKNDFTKMNKLIQIIRNETIDKIIIPHNIEPINEFNNPNLLLGLYPTLFPYGVGGFDDPKRKKNYHTKI